jgi:alpha-glucosidase
MLLRWPKGFLQFGALNTHSRSMSDSEFIATQWWQTGVIYQIYPRSFQDSNGDGIGDLRGITARLDYLAGLGIDAIWISPFYPSPMADFGYDVADYTGVDPLFGTLADFDALLAAAHQKGLRVILDFVPNHTSDQHPWFIESRSSRTNPKRNWYLWHDAAPPNDDWKPARERLPNNWMSHFGGPAWTWDESTKQFYLHSFLKQQPDLNWRNPEVRTAIFSAMRFWLDRGVDGFRMDVLWLLIKDAEFRNNPPNPEYHGNLHDYAATLPVYTADQPETHTIVTQMRALMDSYPDALPEDESAEREAASTQNGVTPFRLPRSNRVLIGEIYLPLPELISYYGLPEQQGPAEMRPPQMPELKGANLPFNFHLILAPWNASVIAEIITNYEHLLPPGAWPNYVLGNHDQSRLATRIGPQQARAAAMLLLTLRGTPTIYYGEELGMTDVPIAPDQVQDPAEKNEPGKGRGRDPERSPMLWIDAPNAGFAPPNATPWLPLETDWPKKNAATQRSDPRSMLTLYRRLLQLRRQHDTLHSGAVADVRAEGSVLRYRRLGLPDGDSGDFLVLLNLGSDIATVQCCAGTVVLTTLLDGAGSRVEGEVTIEAGEGLLIALD